MSAFDRITNVWVAGHGDMIFSVAGECAGARAPQYVNADGEMRRCPEHCLASKGGEMILITVDRGINSQCGRPGATCRITGAPCIIAPGPN